MQEEPNDGGSAFPAMAPSGYCTPTMTLRDYFAANELLSDMCREIWDMNDQYVESIMGREMPSNLNSLEAVKYEAEFFARMRYIRADAMLAAREHQPDTATSQQIALGIGGSR